MSTQTQKEAGWRKNWPGATIEIGQKWLLSIDNTIMSTGKQPSLTIRRNRKSIQRRYMTMLAFQNTQNDCEQMSDIRSGKK